MPSGPITPKKNPQLKVAASPLASALEDDSRDDEESELSQSDLSASEDLSEEGDDDDDDSDDASPEESGTRKEAIQKKALKADITPHHRLEKRPQRETAAKASSAWSHLASSPPPPPLLLSKGKSKGGPIVEVVVDLPSRRTVREEGRGDGKRQVKRPRPLEVEVLVPQAGPSRSPRRQASKREDFIADAKGKEKGGESRTDGTEVTDSPLSRERGRRRGEGEEVHTPTREKKQVPRTPQKQDPPKTPSKSAASKRIADARLSLSTDQWAPNERLFIQPTSSDAYFAHHAPRSKRNSAKHVTSDSILSATFEPIPAEVVSRISHGISERLQADEEIGDDEDGNIITSGSFLNSAHFEPCFDYWWSLLVSTNRPLLVHGVGSKRVHLQTFARYLAREGTCSTVVIRGEAGGRIEDVVRELERCVDGPAQVSAASQLKRRKLFSTTLEARAHGLVSALGGREETEEDRDRGQDHFLVLIHNFDTPLFLQDRSLHILSVLSACRRIHLCVDTCHINSSLLASLHADQEQTPLPWLWIGMNTFVPQLEELINERGSGTSRAIGLPRVLDIRSAGGGGGGLDYYSSIMLADERRGTKNGGAAAAGPSSNASSTALLSERAAIHILRSVTSKARDLFLLLAARLSKDDGANTTTYSDLASLASRNFKATNAEALRSLLVEFTTHNLIRVQGFDNNEQQNQGVPLSTSTVSIALSKRDLRRVYAEFTVEA